MIYEGKVQYKKIGDDGMWQTIKESYAIENCESFGQAEETLYELLSYDNIKDVDVIDIKRSKVKEIANAHENTDDKVFMAEIKDVFTKDDGSTKDIKYKILFFAKNFDAAKVFISEYIAQGYDMILIGLKETSIVDIIA